MPTNYALSSQGSTATVIGSGSSIPQIIDGIKTTSPTWSAAVFQASGGYSVQVDFGTSRDIAQIKLYGMRNAITYTVEATDGETSGFAIKNFDLYYWTGSAWSLIASITDNATTVIKTVDFSAITTSKIKLTVNSSGDGWGYLNEIEAWSVPPDTTPPTDMYLTGISVVNSGEIDVAFNTPSDNVGVTAINFERATDNTFTQNVVAYSLSGGGLTSPFHNTTGLSPTDTTQYFYRAKAVDAALNESANWSNTLSAVVIVPLKVDFTAPTSINFGDVFAPVDTTTKGYGTKSYKWFDASIQIGASQVLSVSNLSKGLHDITLEVTDLSGTFTKTKTIFVGEITGSHILGNGVGLAYATNVPSPVWTIVSGGGTISGSIFTAPNSGSGETIIKAEKTGDATIFATFSIEYPLSADFALPEIIEVGKEFVITNESIGNITGYSLDWGDGEITSNADQPHIYLTTGFKIIVLTCETEFGEQTKSKTIWVFPEGYSALIEEIKILTAWQVLPVLTIDEIYIELKSLVETESENVKSLWLDRNCLLNKVASKLWFVKSGKASAMIEETGVFKTSNQQVYNHCVEMARVYESKNMGTLLMVNG